jgi:SAM-dependent methyltransferase
VGLNHKSHVAFLALARRLGVSFETTLQLGRQTMAPDVPIAKAFEEAGLRPPAGETTRDGYADGLFRLLGAAEVASLDASDWEGATVVHDLNEPLPDELRDRYTAVFDGGTLEHVFEVSRAMRSALQAVRPGGHFLAIASANNLCGHGFYQFSPELYFSFLSAAGFDVEVALLRAARPGARWYAVPDPRDVRRRVDIHGVMLPQFFYVSARRVQSVDIEEVVPQQSDYEAAWSEGVRPRWTARVRERLPLAVRPVARDMRMGWWAARRVPVFARDLRPVRLSELQPTAATTNNGSANAGQGSEAVRSTPPGVG